jgi:hypothetical protein
MKNRFTGPTTTVNQLIEDARDYVVGLLETIRELEELSESYHPFLLKQALGEMTEAMEQLSVSRLSPLAWSAIAQLLSAFKEIYQLSSTQVAILEKAKARQQAARARQVRKQQIQDTRLRAFTKAVAKVKASGKKVQAKTVNAVLTSDPGLKEILKDAPISKSALYRLLTDLRTKTSIK